jgi:hypothetical protein
VLFHESFVPKPGSDMAKKLGSETPESIDLVAELPADAITVIGYKVAPENAKAMAEWATDLTNAMALTQLPPADQEKAAKAIAEIAASAQHESAFAIVPRTEGSGVTLVGYSRVVQPMNWEAVADYSKLMAKVSETNPAAAPVTVDLDADVGRYKGYALHKGAVNYRFSNLPPEQKRLMKPLMEAVMGREVCYAAKDKFLVTAMGPGAVDLVKKAVDRHEAGAKPLAGTDLMKGMDGMAAKTNFICLSNLPLVFKAAAEAVAAGAEDMPPHNKQIIIDTAKTLEPTGTATVMSVAAAGERLNCTLKVPAAEIKAVGKAFRALIPLMSPGAGAPATIEEEQPDEAVEEEPVEEEEPVQ